MWSLEKLFSRTEMPQEAAETVNAMLAKVQNDSEYKELYKDTVDCKENFDNLEERIAQFAQKLCVRKEELALALLCDVSKVMYERFIARGYTDGLFYEACLDLKYKTIECKKNRDCYGVMPVSWYGGFFDAKRLQLGRLQYERMPFQEESFSFGGECITKGQTVINMHIPSAGPLLPEKVDESLARACEMYKGDALGKVLFFVCNSWLLFPKYRELFGKSNVGDFADRFSILRINKQESFIDAWRIFDMPFEGDVSVLPKNTSRQRIFAKYLENNRDYGNAYGVFGMYI